MEAPEMEVDFENKDVAFLYETMHKRDPRKRKVKPVEKHLLQLDFPGVDTSSDDEDYTVEPHSDESHDEEYQGGDDKSFSDDDDDDDDGDDDDDDDDDDENSDNLTESQSDDIGTETEISIAELVENANMKKVNYSGKVGNLKVLICCVCLGESMHSNEEDNEIVECDSCGVSVHEGCYGIDENSTETSTLSSASTEPWFCDPCKAGVAPTCELCPNSGGIYKETDAGRWVHIVCALYTPGVTFMDIDKLSPVTLYEMPYSKWGAKECCLCEDVRFSRTGVSIGCDAGLCRNYFHVTCAQKEGLLHEATQEEEIADPFYAYCKMHVDKLSMKHKKRSWLAVQSHVKQFTDRDIQDVKEKLRMERKLHRHKEKYTEAKQKRPPYWVPKEKVCRYVTSNPDILRKMLRKAELLGINTQAQVASQKVNHRRKFYTAAFSADFVNYYLERNVKMEHIKQHFKELLLQNQRLKQQENILRTKYDQLLSTVKELKEKHKTLQQEGEQIWTKLTAIDGKTPHLPELFKKPQVVSQSPSITSQTPKSPPAIIHVCGICKSSKDQHLLAKCDACKMFYHLECLDPPLTRMPKKTKQMGWQCSECVGSSSDDQGEVTVHPDAPMRLRETIKEPNKWRPIIKPSKKKDSTSAKKGRSKAKKRQTEKVHVERKRSIDSEEKLDWDADVLMTPPSPKQEKRTSQPTITKKARDIEIEDVCKTCDKIGDRTNMVRCDECKFCYHFQCLDPPLKKTPKRRGYSWHCESCDPSDESNEEEEMVISDEAMGKNNSKQNNLENNSPKSDTRRKKTQTDSQSNKGTDHSSNDICDVVDISTVEEVDLTCEEEV